MGLWRTTMGAALAATALAAPTAEAHQRSDGKGGPQREISFERENFAPGSGERVRRGKWPHGRLRVGMTRTHVIRDAYYDYPYFKDFTLRGFDDHIEVWVADDADAVSRGLEFPYGDCRNDGKATRVTDEQVARMIGEWESTIHPRQIEVFGPPPLLDGSEALMPKRWTEIPDSAFKGDPNRVMVLVDNIRDEDFHFPGPMAFGTLGYVARAFPEIYDRHVLVIDGAFWDQMMGPDPVPSTLPAGCPGVQTVERFTVEDVLAHEFNHTLMFAEDPSEGVWLAEGLANWAAALMPYPDLDGAEDLTGFQFNCFLSHMRLCDSGAQNSLTTWGDPGTSWIAGDYGAAHAFVEAFAAQHGNSGVRALHEDQRHGLPSVDALTAGGAAAMLHDWSTAVAIDGVLDDGATLAGADPRRFQLERASAEVKLESPRSYAGPGVTPNGADFVRLRDADGKPLTASQIGSIELDAARTFPPAPVRWTMGDGGLHVGGRALADDAIVREVAVPAGDPVLTFRTRYDIEPGYDFGFVQVSTDGGRTFTSLPGRTSSSNHEPDVAPETVAMLPGFSGNSGGWIDERVDLSAYSGRTILLAFRHVTDPFVDLPGWWVDDVRVGGQLVSDGSSLAGWSSVEEFRPEPVTGLHLRLVGWNADRTRAFLEDVPLDGDFDGGISGEALRQKAGDATTVVAIVNHDDVEEHQRWRPAPYRLMVDGVLQPGG